MGTSSPEVAVATKTKRGKKWCAVFFWGLPSKRDGDVGLCGLEGGLLTCFLEVVVILFGMMCFFSCGFILWRFLGH